VTSSGDDDDDSDSFYNSYYGDYYNGGERSYYDNYYDMYYPDPNSTERNGWRVRQKAVHVVVSASALVFAAFSSVG